ncbi:MAG: hypothetical protein ACQES2_06005 [Pseudomonadota bacterium]
MSIEEQYAAPLGQLSELLASMSPEEQGEWRQLQAMLERVTGVGGELWRDDLVGFGRLDYRRGSGSRGSWFMLGLGWRRRLWVIYSTHGFVDDRALSKQLGRHKLGQCCLYLKGLGGVDMVALERFLERTVEMSSNKTEEGKSGAEERT